MFSKVDLGRIAYEASVDYRVIFSNMARAEFALWDEVKPDNQECFSAMGKAIAKTLIAKMREAMGEEWPIIKQFKLSNLDKYRYCPECNCTLEAGHQEDCSRGRFFAALKELDDA